MIGLDFLRDVGSLPWSAIDLGGVETIHENREACRANHVYVNCPAPFLIAATSFDLSTGEEIFGVAVIRDSVAIEGFLRGPHYPHNKPKTLPLNQLLGEAADAFLKEPKEICLSRRTLKDFVSVTALVTVEQGITIASHTATLRIDADDEVPMSLRVGWTQNATDGSPDGE